MGEHASRKPVEGKHRNAPAEEVSLVKGSSPEAHGHAADAAARRMAKSKTVDSGAWEDEVEGIPANAVRREDDDEQIVSTTTGESHTKLAGKGLQHDKTTTTKEGDSTIVDERGLKGQWKDGEVQAGHTRSHQEGMGEETSNKSASSYGAHGNLHGGGASYSHDSTFKSGETSNSVGVDAAAGIKDGKVEASAGVRRKEEDEHGGNSTSNAASYKDGKVGWSYGREDESKRKETGDDGKEVERSSSRGRDLKVAVGPEGLSADGGLSSTNEQGTKRNATAGVDIDKDKVAVNAGYSIKSKGGSSAGVNAKVGTDVVASKPEKRGDRWVVTYRRTTSEGASASGSSHGGGVTGGASHSSFIDGTRSFDTKEEADEFREHAKERLQFTADPTTVAGAMSLEVGETRGAGTANEGSVGASGSVEGATVGVSAHKSGTQEVKVRRVSENVFEATYAHASEKGKDAEVGGYGVTTGAGSSSSAHDGLTVRFDLTTPDGKAAFEKFTKDHQAPAKGGELVSKNEGKGKESHDGTKVAGLGKASYGKQTAEETTVDDKGKHETYSGGQTHDVSTTRVARWLGDKDQHSSVEIVSRQENDKDAGYTIEGHFGGDSGAANRGKMMGLMGAGDEQYDEGKVDKGHSGEWTMSADVDKKAIDYAEKHDARYQGLTTNDDKMRALAQMVAEKGTGGVHHLEDLGQKLSWDVELKGDKNFPGRDGRIALEAKIARLGAELGKNPAEAPAVLSEVQGELNALHARRTAVDDRKQYLDLPEHLRVQQLTKIDEEIGRLDALRHQAAIESTKNQPGEKKESIQQRHFVDKGAFAGLPPQQAKLAELRDELALTDGTIQSYDAKNHEASEALKLAQYHTLDSRRTPELNHSVQEGFKTGTALQVAHAKEYKALDELRVMFLANSQNVDVALSMGQELNKQLQAQVAKVESAYSSFESAAVAQVQMNDKSKLGKYRSFWEDIAASSMEEEQVAAIDEVPDTSDRDEKPAPVKPTGMRL